MCIERVIVKNYRTLASVDLAIRPHLNIIVGNNESGKSTLLEAMNLALKCQLNRRHAAAELHPYLFNTGCVRDFVTKLRSGVHAEPPRILIELYLKDCPDFAAYKGTNNSLSEDKPGISLAIELDHETFGEEYSDYIADPMRLNGVPVEYYKIDWKDFADCPVNARMVPVESTLVDPSSISNTYAANKYVLEIARDFLTKKQKVELALSYRHLRDTFLDDASVKLINTELEKQTGTVTEKTLSIALDMTARAGWETGVLPHLDDIPLTLIGKGEQNAVKIKLAIAAEEACPLFLLEEPENHLSHANLNRLIAHIAETAKGRQFIITTHSSFVLNKLGVENVLMFNGKKAITLSQLPTSTEAYFKKLPGHDTLRMILADKTVLVEGPSDELIVQKAFFQKHGKMPLEAGVEVISVNALAFKRFLDIAKLLDIDTCVVTDNDGSTGSLKAKFADYDTSENICLCYSSDESLRTLEYHMVNLNSRDQLNRILGKAYATDDELLSFMLNNKTDCALKIFDSPEALVMPQYIQDAIK
jgi:ABC-type cobalamin/Fe3+-siderophores transport system ATPase subunit